jgi:peptidoglycan hydrolase-like protein with peptidoglycan-binding domain
MTGCEFDLIGANFGDNMVEAFNAHQPALDDVRNGEAVLKRGTKGEAVKHVQKKLGVSSESEFGAKTEAAVRTFQRAKKLPETGIVDLATMALLDGSAYIIHETAPPLAKPAAPPMMSAASAPPSALRTYLGYLLAALGLGAVGWAVMRK